PPGATSTKCCSRPISAGTKRAAHSLFVHKSGRGVAVAPWRKQLAPRSCERRWNRKICAFEAQSKNPRHQRDLRGPCLQISLLADCSRVGRGKCSHSQLLENATSRALERLAVFKCVVVDRQGERRTNADGRLRLERATRETLRSRFRAKDRGSLVSEKKACRRISARRESRAGEDVSGNQKVGTPRCGVRLKC